MAVAFHDSRVGGAAVGAAAALSAAVAAGVPRDLPDPQPEPGGCVRRRTAGQENHQGESG